MKRFNEKFHETYFEFSAFSCCYVIRSKFAPSDIRDSPFEFRRSDESSYLKRPLEGAWIKKKLKTYFSTMIVSRSFLGLKLFWRWQDSNPRPFDYSKVSGFSDDESTHRVALFVSSARSQQTWVLSFDKFRFKINSKRLWSFLESVLFKKYQNILNFTLLNFANLPMKRS